MPSSLADAGFSQANAGLTDDAAKTTAKITVKSVERTKDFRGRVQAEIASALARAGKFEEAIEAAKAIPERVIRFTVKDKVQERHDSMQRGFAFKKIIEAQLKHGDPAGAAKTARLVTDKDQRLGVMQDVILGYAKAGDDAAAKKLFDEARKAVESGPAARHRRGALAMLQAAIGDSAGAVAWAEKIKSPEDRSETLIEISIGLAYREQWKQKR